MNLVVAAWRERISRYAEVHLVADRSLLAEFPKAERKQVGSMRRRGRFMVARDADDVLLELAESRDGCVLSRDRFLDKRRGRRWIAERFYTWYVEDGQVQIGRRASLNTQSFDISRKEEQKDAQSNGIPDLDHPVTKRRWACASNIPCPTREASPDFIQVLPILDREVVRCPGCRQPLHDLGKRPNEIELKVVLDDLTVARFRLMQGETVTFGRTTLPSSPILADLTESNALADVGRTHAELRIVGKNLAVRPVDKEHPVWVRRWRKMQLLREEEKLHHTNGFSPIGLRDTLVFGRHLELRRSGRSIAEAEALATVDASAGLPRGATA